MDTSEATTEKQLQQIINHIRTQLTAYSIGANKVRVALVTYGASQSTILNLRDGVNYNSILKGLYSMRREEGNSDLPKALNFVHDNVIKTSRSGKPTIVSVFATQNPLPTSENELKSAKEKLETRPVKILVTVMDKAGLTGPLSRLANVDQGYVVPNDEGDLVSVLPDSMDALDKALCEYSLILLQSYYIDVLNILENY